VSENIDLIVIGAGPGGYVLALESARRGLSVTLVDERETLGGTCLNVGCIPSKALLESSELFARIADASKEHGIDVDPPKLNMKGMMKRKNAVVEKLTSGVAGLMKARGVTVIRGRGLVTAPGTVKVDTDGNTKEFKSDRICLATGSVPAELPFLPFDGKRVVDSTGALGFDKVPGRLVVIGAGAIGLELGSVWARLGSRVTVVEAMPQILPEADAQVARTLTMSLKKQGLDIRTGTAVTAAEVTARQVAVDIETDPGKGGRPETLKADRVLVAVGRKTALESALGDGAVPDRTPDGRFFAVDGTYRTSVPGLYAIGDVIPGPMLAHKAEEEGSALAAILAGDVPAPRDTPIPGIVYTEPEAAWVGDSEESLKTSGKKYEKGSFPFAANGRSLAAGSAEGFVKILTEPGDRRLLGVHIVGPRASELIAEAVTVLAFGGSAEDIALTVHGHPTLSEVTKEAALAAIGRPLHRAG
jgi:dihydrolipoamide dehydrogenase